jgi:hypothetical protein
VIRLGSLAGYPFEGPRLLAGWTPPAVAAVYAIAYKPDPETRPERYAVIYVGHSDDLTTERFPFRHPRAACWVQRAGSRWKIYVCTYQVPGGGRATSSSMTRPGRTTGSASTRPRRPARCRSAARTTPRRASPPSRARTPVMAPLPGLEPQ